MRTYLLLILFLVAGHASAQRSPAGLVDIVQLRAGGELTGTILSYEYNRKIIMITDTGEEKTIDWQDIRRVSYVVDKSRNTTRSVVTVDAPDAQPVEVPDRPWFHHVSVGSLLGVEQDPTFFRQNRIIGLSVNYFHARKVGPITAGIGADYAIFSYSRREGAAALLAMLEYSVQGRKERKFAPFARLLAGPAIPVGLAGDEDEITSRRVGLMFQPSVGLEFRCDRNDFNNLFFDVGYRFYDTTFEVTTSTLDILERRVSYQRLSIRAGFRF